MAEQKTTGQASDPAGGGGVVATGERHDHAQYSTLQTMKQSPLRATLSALLTAADHEERLYADLAAWHISAAAWHVERAGLVRMRRSRLEFYAFGRGAGR